MRKKSEILEIMKLLGDENPSPVTELFFTNAYTLLVAIALSAQSTDKGVNKATPALFEIADTPQKMLDLGLDNLKTYIKTIGLYNNKAKNIISLSKRLIEEYNGEVPHSREALETLDGIGRKTANVILSVWWKEPTIAVDTHVLRTTERLELTDGRTPISVEKELEKVLPVEYKLHASHWLVLFGRYVCKAKKPDCANCVVKQFCHSKDKNL